MSGSLDKELKNRIKQQVANQNKLIKEYNKAKEEVDKVLNTYILGDGSTEGLMSDNDIINNDAYIEYYKTRTTNPVVTAAFKDDWINSFKGDEGRKARIRLASEYSIDGTSDWAKKVKDAETSKKRAKEVLRVEGKKVIDNLHQLLSKFDKEIKEQEEETEQEIQKCEKEVERLNESINTLRAEKSKLMTEYQKSKNKDTPQYNSDLAKIEADINAINGPTGTLKAANNKLKSQKGKLTKIKNKKAQRDDYEKAINDAEKKFSEALHKGANVEVQIDSNSYKDDSNGDNSSNNINTGTTNRTTSMVQTDKRKGTAIVAAQTIDLRHASTFEIIEMLDSNQGYGELLEAARESGHFSRKVVKNEIIKRLDDLLRKMPKSGSGDIEIGDVKIKAKDLYNLKDLKMNKIMELVDQVEKYYNKYDSIKGHEQKKTDNEMQVLKLAVLLAETNTNKVARWFRKYNLFSFGLVGKRGQMSRIQDFGNNLRDIATKIEQRQEFQFNTKNSVLKALGYKEDDRVPKKKSLDRSGKKAIQQPGRAER